MYTTTKITVKNGAIYSIDGARSTGDLAYAWSRLIPGEWPYKLDDCHKTLKGLFGVHTNNNYDIIVGEEGEGPCNLASYRTPATREYVQAVGVTVNKLYQDFVEALYVPQVLPDGIYEVGYQMSIEKL